MVTRLVLSLVAVVVVTGCSWAQEPEAAQSPPNSTTVVDDGPPAAATDDTDAGDIFSGVDNETPSPAETAADDTTMAASKGEEAADNAAPADEGPDMTAVRKEAVTNSDKVFELTERVAALETELQELKQTLYNTRRALVQLQDSGEVENLKQALYDTQQSLAQLQDSGELSRRALGAMVEDSDLRGTMGELLQGKVCLNNTTGGDVVMYINGTAWTVTPGKSFVLAPVGTVSFLYDPVGKPEFKGIQEWVENENSGQFELEYEVRTPGTSATESSVVRLP